jgi:hypothetical protein
MHRIDTQHAPSDRDIPHHGVDICFVFGGAGLKAAGSLEVATMNRLPLGSVAVVIGILLNPTLPFTAAFLAYLILKPITSHQRLIEGGPLDDRTCCQRI